MSPLSSCSLPKCAGKPSGGLPSNAFLFDLAPRRVNKAEPVTRLTGKLLPYRFTLASMTPSRDGSAVYFLLHFPSARLGLLPSRYEGRCPVESGLSSSRYVRNAIACFPHNKHYFQITKLYCKKQY
jgi:hypothetical protein